MQLMTWTISRLGSRFNLLFEPHLHRVRHSALGRFLDQPMDLMVGLVEPDGTERVLPFTTRGTLLYNCEQFERLNSITFRGYSERYRLRYEFNLHSVFYPQDEPLCIMPVFYMEMRVSPADRVRWTAQAGPRPDKVAVFIRLDRPDTGVNVSADTGPGQPRQAGCIDLSYRETLTPSELGDHRARIGRGPTCEVHERILSLNAGCTATPDGKGLMLQLPVAEEGHGIKWRLVWGAHCPEPVLRVGPGQSSCEARLRYLSHWSNLDVLMDDAVKHRDDRLAHSRRFERLIDQAPLSMAQRHLLNQSFQAYLSNTFWCDLDNQSQWFSVWEGSCYRHGRIDVEYNVSLFYLTLWPPLLAMQLEQWTAHERPHEPSGGGFLSHDMGAGFNITGQSYPHDMPVEENCNYLLLMQAHAHWTGDLTVAQNHPDLIQRLAAYLIWTDRDGCGFPSEGTANTIDDASPATQYARKQTYLAVKRLVALRAAADLLRRVDPGCADAGRYERVVETDQPKIEQQAWIVDHYAVCTDRSVTGIRDTWTGESLPYEEMPGWDAYSIYTGNGLLLPVLTDQSVLMDSDHLETDLINTARETLSAYGCGHSSYEPENVWVSQNLWRDHLARYLNCNRVGWPQRYWDMQVMSNTHQQSQGYCDTYISNNLSFNPRGITSMGFFLAHPRLVIDRLAESGTHITVNPDRHYPQRWPLLPLADWKAGRIPVCVVDTHGAVLIESESDPVKVLGEPDHASTVVG